MPDIIDNVKVGEYIKKLLKKHNMTQDDLADALSISKSAVSQNLRGKSSFDIQNLIQIAKLFEITLDDLLNLKTIESDDVISEYQKIVQKGLPAITNVPAQNLRISEPDIYGKVFIDYVIEARQKEMFSYLHNHQLSFVEDYYHRAKEIYLKIIKYMLEEDMDDLLSYILAYTKLHGSFDIEDEQLSLVIWGLLDKPNIQPFVSALITYRSNPKPIWSFKKDEVSLIPLTKIDIIEAIAKYHLKNVLKTFMNTKQKDEDLYEVVLTFIEHNFIEGIHLYIDHFYQNPLTWFRKSSLDVQKTHLEVLKTGDLELISKFASRGLYTDLTPIVKQSILSHQFKIASHLIATYHDSINFKKIGEACVLESQVELLEDMMTYLSKDDLNYLLSYVKLSDMKMMLYLIRQGARVDEKYYNLETFKKINQLIDYILTKGELS